MITRVGARQTHWGRGVTVFALLALAVYYPVILGWIPFPRYMVLQWAPWWHLQGSNEPQQTANIGDLVTSFYPFHWFAASAVRSGSLPLWNPYLLGSTPFLANAQSAVFYPLTALYYLFSTPFAWAAGMIVHLFLAGFFTWLFVKSIGGSEAGAIASGILFACCGFMTAWQGQAMGAAAAWLPLIFYAVHRLRTDQSSRSCALAAVAFAMPVLAGHPETALHATFAGVAWTVVLWAAPMDGRRFDFRFLRRFAVAGLLAMGLAAVQILPTVEWIGQIEQRLASVWPPLPLFQALALVSRDVVRDPNSAGIYIPEGAAYVGMASLLLLPLAAFHDKRRYVIFFAAATLIALGVSYGVEPFRWIAEHAPLIQSLKNSRLILVASFSAAVLAGLGLSAFERMTVSGNSPQRRKVAAYLVVALILGLLLVYALQQTTGFRVEFMRRPSFSRSLLLLSAVPMFWRLAGGLRGKLFPWVMCLLVAFDLTTFSHGFTAFARASEIFPKAPLFDFLKARANEPPSRIAQVGAIYVLNGSMVYGLSALDGYDVPLDRARRFFADYSQQDTSGLSFLGDRFFEPDDRRIDMLNVKYFVVGTTNPEFEQFARRSDRYSLILKEPYISVYENRRALPRAFAVPTFGIEAIEGAANQMARVKSPSFNPEQSVVVSSTAGVIAHPVPPSPTFESTVEQVSAGPNEYRFKTTATLPAVLVVSQIYYPGWKALVDGHEVPVFEADYALTGLTLPEGAHDVRLVFYSATFRIGLILTCISAAILGLMARPPRCAAKVALHFY